MYLKTSYLEKEAGLIATMSRSLTDLNEKAFEQKVSELPRQHHDG
jgi:hypothetical protein